MSKPWIYWRTGAWMIRKGLILFVWSLDHKGSPMTRLPREIKWDFPQDLLDISALWCEQRWRRLYLWYWEDHLSNLLHHIRERRHSCQESDLRSSEPHYQGLFLNLGNYYKADIFFTEIWTSISSRQDYLGRLERYLLPWWWF